jgi:hypothetical protein
VTALGMAEGRFRTAVDRLRAEVGFGDGTEHAHDALDELIAAERVLRREAARDGWLRAARLYRNVDRAEALAAFDLTLGAAS